MHTTTNTQVANNEVKSITRMFRKVLVACAVALGVSAVSVGAPAHADIWSSSNSPNTWINGYGAGVSTLVTCDKANHVLYIQASATTMMLPNYGVGPYDNGQYATIKVETRDVTYNANSGWSLLYPWQGWQVLRGYTYSNTVLSGAEKYPTQNNLTVNGRTVIPASGLANHYYQVRISIDWWTGAHSIVSFTPTYYQRQAGYPTNPSACWL